VETAIGHRAVAPTFLSRVAARAVMAMSPPEKEKTTMKSLWQWLKDRWVEHHAFKLRTITRRPHQRLPQGSTPIVGTAEDAYWRLLIEGRR
jgi:hypothetical protein